MSKRAAAQQWLGLAIFDQADHSAGHAERNAARRASNQGLLSLAVC